jgi:hypothetical protein
MISEGCGKVKGSQDRRHFGIPNVLVETLAVGTPVVCTTPLPARDRAPTGGWAGILEGLTAVPLSRAFQPAVAILLVKERENDHSIREDSVVHAIVSHPQTIQNGNTPRKSLDPCLDFPKRVCDQPSVNLMENGALDVGR